MNTYTELVKRNCKDCGKEIELERSSRTQRCNECNKAIWEKRKKVTIKRQRATKKQYKEKQPVERIRLEDFGEVSEKGVPKAVCRKCKEIIFTANPKAAFIICDECKPSREQLYQRYVVEKTLKREIAEEYGLSEKMIKGLLKKYGIEKKTVWSGYFKNRCHVCKKDFVSKTDGLIRCPNCIENEEELFRDKKEIEDYVVCKICGEKKKSLIAHVTRLHGISCEEYKEKYGPTISKKLLDIRIDQCPSPNAYNKDEETIDNLSENLVFVGASKKGCKRFLVGKERIRNPDFAVITDEDYLKTLQDLEWWEKQNKVTEDFRLNKIEIKQFVEFNGFYWHSRNFNDRTKEVYEKDMINDYKKAGFECLVVWDYELIENVDLVTRKLNNFIVKPVYEVNICK